MIAIRYFFVDPGTMVTIHVSQICNGKENDNFPSFTFNILILHS